MVVEKVNIEGIEFNKTDNELSWRLIFTDKKVIQLFQSDGYTQSTYNIFLANSKEACLTEIYRLNLEYKNSEINYNP